MTVRIGRRDRVATVTIDRPEVRNALDDQTMRSLAAAFDELAEDAGVRAVVLTGSGDRAFCAGVDLKAFADRDPTEPMGDWLALVPFFRTIYPKPLLAAVNGAAVAGGMELLLACDIIVAADHAVFGIAEVRRGLIAAGGGTDLPRRIPLGLALEMGLTGSLVDAARAERIGLVNLVVPGPDVLEHTQGLARQIAANAPLALRYTKELMYATLDVDRLAARDLAEQAAAVVNASQDAKEGSRAFVEKRAPEWSGQ